MKKVGRSGERYISYYSGYYNIQKRINGKAICFARFHTLKEAIEYRDKLVEQDWSMSLRLVKPPRPVTGMKYIQRVTGGYQVNKRVNGKKMHYGYFKDKRDAMKHRDYCISHDWSEDCIRRCYKKHNLPDYITYNRGGYVVQKYNRDKEWVGIRFRDLDDAVHERDLLVSVDWDEERLMELDEARGTL